MRRAASRLVVLFLALASVGNAAIERVVLISMDGLRGDFLKTVLDTAPEEVPNFKRMRDLGACTFNARTCHTWTLTVGNHVAMVTGRPADQALGLPNTAHHGFLLNDPPASYTVHANGNPNVPYKFSIYDMVHDRGFTTAGYFNKLKFTAITTSYDADHGAPDLVGADNGRAKIDVAPPPGPVYVNTFITEVNESRMKHFTMLHIADMDFAGHAYTWSIAPGSVYRQTLHNLDTQFGAILNAILGNPAYAGKTAIIVVADHGGGAPGDPYGHFIPGAVETVTTPFMLLAPGVTGGTDIHQWFENRFDPGNSIPSYIAPAQPMRNVDAANLVATLMGVPSVPGSVARPLLKRTLKVERTDDAVKISWPIYLTGHKLEYTDDLSSAQWTPVTEGISDWGDLRICRDRAKIAPKRFYRLRSPE